jgi:hypothetical protein
VVDSGVNAALAEFAGKVDARSADLAGTRGVGDDGGHGTAVSDVLLGARNGSGIHGVAFNATLLAARTDDPGSCAKLDANGNPGCTHSDAAIAAGLDLARTSGAKVVNISLGGSAGSGVFVNAINRATAAGIIVVISAGNDGTANPDAFAQVANGAASHGLVIIAGGVDSSNILSVYRDANGNQIGASAAAGNSAAHYIAALGTRVRSIDQNGTSFLYGGTSFSAPIVAGAVALLEQAYPSLTPTQVVNLLFSTATNIGPSSTYGFGELNIAAAFQAQGATSVAGTQVPVSLTGTNVILSTAMGNASQTGASSLILDSYGRAFNYELGSGVRAAPAANRLADALDTRFQSRSAVLGQSALALSIAGGESGMHMRRLTLNGLDDDRARALAGSVITRLSPHTFAAFGVAQTGSQIAGQLRQDRGPAFLIAGVANSSAGFDQRAQTAAALRHDFSGTGLMITAESGTAQVYDPQGLNRSRPDWHGYGYGAVSVGVDRRLGPLTLAARMTSLAERQTVLGARFGALNGFAGARSWFADLDATWEPERDWRLGASWRQGWTHADTGGIVTGGLIKTRAWSLDIQHCNVFGGDDSWALRLARPLRVVRGGLALNVAQDYDYATLTTRFAAGRFNLTPTGHELDLESAYSRPFAGGALTTNVYWRRDPGNVSNAPDDLGAALRYSRNF